MGDRDRLAALLHELFCDEVCRYDPDLGGAVHRELAGEADALLLLGVRLPDDRELSDHLASHHFGHPSDFCETCQRLARPPGDRLREAALAKILRAERAVDDLCQGRLRWEMRVPAEPDHDPDLIISDALGAARAALEADR